MLPILASANEGLGQAVSRSDLKAPSSFVEYAASEGLSPDETYTVELLIEKVRSDFDPNHWDDWSARGDAREKPEYKPSFSTQHVLPAAARLEKLSWISLQRIRGNERPVRNLVPLRYLPNLTGLVLIDTEVSDLTPLSHCKKLRELHLTRSPVRDISALADCRELEMLHLDRTQIEDLSVLAQLRKLRELSISAKHIPSLRKLKNLPALEKLELDTDSFDSFDGFPSMPSLRVIRGANVRSLSGLQGFPALENLVNFSGQFDSLEPLSLLRNLTHANFTASRVHSLDPLSALGQLRALWLHTEVRELDISPLKKLPMLHTVTVKCANEEVPELYKLRAGLSSWDREFLSPAPRHVPSLKLEVVDQETFDRYDTRESFGVTDLDRNERLLESELVWLDGKMEEALAQEFEADDDFQFPFRWGGARSRTMVLSSKKILNAFPKVVLKIQNVLCLARRDWIIYLQDEDSNFTVWVYPDKIVVTPEQEGILRRLVQPE